ILIPCPTILPVPLLALQQSISVTLVIFPPLEMIFIPVSAQLSATHAVRCTAYISWLLEGYRTCPIRHCRVSTVFSTAPLILPRNTPWSPEVDPVTWTAR